MTTRDLIELLEDLERQHGECDVRLAMQPAWPFEYDIDAVAAVELGNPDPDEYDMDDPEDRGRWYEAVGQAEPGFVVYLGEGEQLGYLPGEASRELGWR